MAITTYAELKAAVYAWLLRDSTTDLVITDERVTDYITLCEAELSRELKIRELEEEATLTASTSTDIIALPSDYRGMIDLQYDSGLKCLEYEAQSKLSRNKSDRIGRPKKFTIKGTNVKFDRTPDSEYTLTLDYYESIEALSDSNASNVILSKFPDVYLYGTLHQALLNINDQKRQALITPIYTSIVDRIKEEDKNSQIPSGSRMKSPYNRNV